jgi:hypothetical protein
LTNHLKVGNVKEKHMISTLNNINPATPIGKLELAAIDTTEFTDAQFEGILMEHEIPNKKGLQDLLKVLETTVKKNRPNLYQKMRQYVNKIKLES